MLNLEAAFLDLGDRGGDGGVDSGLRGGFAGLRGGRQDMDAGQRASHYFADCRWIDFESNFWLFFSA